MNVLGLLDVPDLLVVFGIISTALYFYLTKDHGMFKAMGVPGPKPLPWFGNRSVYEMPVDERYRVLREKYGKVYGLFLAKFPLLVIGDLDLIREVMVKDFPTFRNRMHTEMDTAQVPPVTEILFNLEGDYWKTIRSIITPTFTTGKLKNLVGIINGTSKTLVSVMKPSADKKEDIAVRDFTGSFSMDAIASVAFGVDLDCQRDPENKFGKMVQILLQGDPNKKFAPTAWAVLLFPFLAPLVHKWTRFMGWKNAFESDEAVKFLENTALETLALRQTTNKKFVDYLQLLKDAKISSSSDDNQDKTNSNEKSSHHTAVSGDTSFRALSRDELVAQCLMFIIAGQETTATGLMYSFYALAVYPEIQDKLVTEINEHIPQDSDPGYDDVAKCQYLECFLMETLRIYPPVANFNRTAGCDTRLGHYFLPKGTNVVLPVYQIHHDPDIWESPEMFDPERFQPDKRAKHHPAQWLPFGLGPRLCVGKRLALLEMKIALVHVLRQYRFSKSDKTEIPIKLGKNDFFLAVIDNPIIVRVENRET